MSLAALYQSFLAAPATAPLAEDATLEYITTLITIADAAKIVRHVTSRDLKKQNEKIVDVVEGQSALFVQVETTIEFVSSGGAYLPGMDDNFLTDHTVTFPVMHLVRFDALQRIQQIQLHWDQGSLLKSLDVVGARGKNWPITDGKEQARMILSSARRFSKSSAATKDIDALDSSKDSKTMNKDPHASLSLFGPRETTPESSIPSSGVPPSSSAKPPARRYDELFVGNDSPPSHAIPSNGRSFAGGKQSVSVGGYDTADQQTIPSNGRSFAGGKQSVSIGGAQQQPKTHLGKNLQQSRLIGDEGGSQEATPRPSPSKRYDHFDFGDGSEEGAANPVPTRPSSKAKSSKHGSQWDSEDFVTPQKPSNKVRGQDVRHFGWSDDEVLETPAKNPKPVHPRRDAESHFEFRDDGTPVDQKKMEARSKAGNGHGLYTNNIYDEGEGSGAQGDQAKAKGTLSNVSKHNKYFDNHFSLEDESPVSSNKDDRNRSSNAPNATTQAKPLGPTANANKHNKYFDSHFSMEDDSPPSDEKTGAEKKPPVAGHKAAIKMMGSNWDTYDQSPEQSKKENVEEKAAPSNANRTGSRHGPKASVTGHRATDRNWGFGDDSDVEDNKASTQGSRPASSRANAPSGGGFWDF
ncbi:MAG: hypothetical protein M4579_003961 [Chaenotheca gracillima]|nr:MAG: hypothetical protein M4579_003961 [Chaenotheca gracillima]